MKFSRGVLLALIIVVSVGLIGCQAAGTGGGGEEAAGEVEEVNVGVVMPLTGANAQFGQNSLRGIELAAQMINEDGGIKSMNGVKIKLNVADSTSEPTRAASATQQFLSSEGKPVAVIGAYASSLTKTVSQVTERAQVPLLTTSFSDELTAQDYKYIFRVAPRATDVGAAQLEYAVEMAQAAGSDPRRVAIAFTNDEYGTSQAEGLRSAAERMGLEVALFEPYEGNITNATPLARKITGANADILFPVSYLADGIQIMRALEAGGSDLPVVGGVGGFITPDFQDALGDSVNGIFSVMTSAPDKYGVIGEMYEEEHGTFMPQEAHDNAAALSVIAQALEANPTTDPTKLADTLHSEDFDEGVAAQMPGGHVKFDEAGNNVVIEPLMVQWQEGNLVSVWPEDLAESEPNWPAE